MDAIYAVLLVVIMLRSFNCKNRLLEELGNHSLNIWMAHAFLLQFIYKYEYDILSLAALILFSYVFSVVVNIITNPIESLIKKTVIRLHRTS